MDPRPIALVIIVAILILIYFNVRVLFWLVILGLFIALIVLIYIVLRGEGKIKLITNFFRKLWKKYKKIERKFFKFWDEL